MILRGESASPQDKTQLFRSPAILKHRCLSKLGVRTDVYERASLDAQVCFFVRLANRLASVVDAGNLDRGRTGIYRSIGGKRIERKRLPSASSA